MADSSEHLFTVHEAKQTDVYKDIIRVHESVRDGVREGRICRVCVNGKKSALFSIRGLPDCEKNFIRIDDIGRDRLKLSEKDQAAFTFAEVSWTEAVRWAAKAADPGARIATWIAIWSGGLGVVLGIVGVILGAYPLLK